MKVELVAAFFVKPEVIAFSLFIIRLLIDDFDDSVKTTKPSGNLRLKVD